MGYQVDHLSLSPDPAIDSEHTGAQHDAAVLLDGLCPDNDIGDPGVVLDGDEHAALGRARPLANEHEAGGP